MVNDDVQDDDVDFVGIRTVEDMKQRCRKELAALPPRIERNFPSERPANSIRVLQWNILSQCKHFFFFQFHHYRSRNLMTLISLSNEKKKSARRT